MIPRTLLLLCVFLPGCGALAQQVSNPKASLVDITQRRAELAHTTDPRTLAALHSLAHCSTLPFVAPPTGRIIIPRHYLNGSHGPTNPEEAKATRTYNELERRVTAGMNDWLATANPREAQCAQAQIDAWAQAQSLLDYDAKESSQAWFQVEWTLSSLAVSESVLLNEPSLDPAILKRDLDWLDRTAHRMIGFESADVPANNHHYWRGLAATATGIICNDNDLFGWGLAAYREAIDALDANGALPQEMARHERAIQYQSFALQPLAPLAALAERQHIPLFAYRSPTGKTFADATDFLGKAVADPAVIKPYTPDQQDTDYSSPAFFSFAEFFSHYSKGPLPPPILQGLQRPTFATRVGGNITVLDGYIPPRPRR